MSRISAISSTARSSDKSPREFIAKSAWTIPDAALIARSSSYHSAPSDAPAGSGRCGCRKHRQPAPGVRHQAARSGTFRRGRLRADFPPPAARQVLPARPVNASAPRAAAFHIMRIRKNSFAHSLAHARPTTPRDLCSVPQHRGQRRHEKHGHRPVEGHKPPPRRQHPAAPAGPARSRRRPRAG